MCELIVKVPENWVEVFSAKNEKVLNLFSKERLVIARICRLKFFEGVNGLRHTIENKVLRNGATIMDSVHRKFVHRGCSWYKDTFTCFGNDRKYWYFYYTILDNDCIMLKMSTNNEFSVLQFQEEAIRLIDGIDYSSIFSVNIIVCGNREYRVKTPPGYRLSMSSTDDHLLFLGDSGYVLVNVQVNGGLLELVQDLEEDAALCIDSCEVSFCDVEENIVRYLIYSGEGKWHFTATGTYCQLENGIVSYIYQRGSEFPEVSNLLRIE